MRSLLQHFPLVLSSALLLALVIRLATMGLSWIGVAALVIAVVWFGFECARWLLSRESARRKRPAGPGDEPDPEPEEDLVSLVYFLSEPRPAEEETVRRGVANGLDLSFDVSDPDSEYFVMPFAPPVMTRTSSFVGATDGSASGVISSARTVDGR